MTDYDPIPEDLIIKQFEEFLYSSDNAPLEPINIILDKKMRYQVKGDKGRETGAVYCVHSDGYPAGYVNNYRDSVYLTWKFDIEELKQNKKYEKLYKQVQTPEYKKYAEERRKQHELEEKQETIDAVKRAQEIYNKAKDFTGEHDYLKRKQVKAHEGVKILNGALLIPLRNINGEFMSYQRIKPDGDKLYAKDALTGEAFYSMGLDELSSGSPILLCEGYATGATLRELAEFSYDKVAVICAMSCGTIQRIATSLRDKYRDNKIIVMADDDSAKHTDGKNPGVEAGLYAVKFANLDEMFTPPFDASDRKDKLTDWNDYAVKHGADKTREIINDKLIYAYKSQQEREDDARVEAIRAKYPLINASDLMHMEFPPIKWAVPGIIPSGLSMLCGNPKAGKSLMALHFATAIAYGGYALGNIKCEQGRVLYLALEDTKQRLQRRLKQTLINPDDESGLVNLDIQLDIPRQNDGGILYLEWYLKQYSNTRLIIIDTFQKFRKQLSSRGNIYSEDYDAAGEIKRIADKYAVAILVIHHLRKLLDMSDPFNEISGSQGLAGSADTNIIWKRPRQQEKGTIEFSGRDVEEKKYYLSCTKFADQFLWSLGDEIRAEDETTAGLSKEKQDIINYLRDNGGKTPKEVSDALKMNYNTCQQRLARMVQENLLRKTGAIYYSQDD